MGTDHRLNFGGGTTLCFKEVSHGGLSVNSRTTGVVCESRFGSEDSEIIPHEADDKGRGWSGGTKVMEQSTGS